jgi:hypothetical protein
VPYSITATKAPSRLGFRTGTAAALDGVHALRRNGFTEIGITNLATEAQCTEACLSVRRWRRSMHAEGHSSCAPGSWAI